MNNHEDDDQNPDNDNAVDMDKPKLSLLIISPEVLPYPLISIECPR